MLSTLGTILKWAILLPILLAIVLLAVANDQTVTVHLNPFDRDDPVLRVDLALYQVAFLIFVIGVLFGGAIVWGRGRRSRRVRSRREESALWQARAEWSEHRPPAPERSDVSAFLPRPGRS